MQKKQFKHKFADFLQKMQYRYRVSITNENTLEETWYAKLTRFNLVLFISGFFLLTFIIITLIVFVTPLKHYLPGYQDSGNRIEMMQQSIVVDSLQNQIKVHDAYLEVVKNIINGTPKTAENKPIDSLDLDEQATKLLEKTEREKEFVEEYEDTEKYNLNSIATNNVNDKLLVFFRPVDGVIATKFNPKEESFGISLITSPQETVKSVLEGRVIGTEYSFENEWVIQVQHNDGYISIYKNNVRLLKKIGDFVKAGQSIAITGSEKKENSKNFYFEIWKNMSPQNPQDLITFTF